MFPVLILNITLQSLMNDHFSFVSWSNNAVFNLRKGKHGVHGEKTASVLLNMFISNERCHTIDAL